LTGHHDENGEYHTDVFCPRCGRELDVTGLKANEWDWNGDYVEEWSCGCGCRFAATYNGEDDSDEIASIDIDTEDSEKE